MSDANSNKGLPYLVSGHLRPKYIRSSAARRLISTITITQDTVYVNKIHTLYHN